MCWHQVFEESAYFSGAFVWGCSEKVPTATGFVENDRVEGAIDKKPRQWHVAGWVRSLRLWGLGV
jgi:hypothetical protein